MRICAHSCLLPAALLTLLCVGCGDDSSADDAGPLPEDQCVGANDLSIIEALAEGRDSGVPDGGGYPYAYLGSVTDEVDVCGEPCFAAILAEEGVVECFADCLSATPAAGLSYGCIACNAELIDCVTENCLTVCVGDDAQACDVCGRAACGGRLEACTGLPNGPTPGTN